MEAVPGSSFPTRIALRSRAWCDHDLRTFHKEGIWTLPLNGQLPWLYCTSQALVLLASKIT